MYGIDRKRYLWVILSALLQGLLLGQYAVTRSGPFLALPLPLLTVLPFAFWLAQEHWGRRLKRFLGGLTLVLSTFCAYRLWSLYPPDGMFLSMPSQSMDLLRICMAAFLLLPFFQCRIATWSWHVPYSDVFFQLCRNVFLLFQAAIMTVVFWALLLTASLLFDIVGLDFVPGILFHPLVAAPLTSLTVAISITLALKHPGIDSLGRWILSILAWLLPPFSALSFVFIACLPYSGLKTLWSTGQASSLMLLLQLGTILLANAAWLDGTRSPFNNRAVGALAKVSLLCLPAYTALCLYSLGLRIQQYGLSVDRIHAAFLVVVTGIWGLGYAGAVLLRQWPSAIGRINIASVLILSVLVVAMNSPLLDPYRLAANNQVDRLLGGQIAPADFDYLYLRFSLGRYGNYALARLKDAAHPRAESIRRRIEAAMRVDPLAHWRDVRSGTVPESQRRDILHNAAVYPAGRRLSPELVERLIRLWEGDDGVLRSLHRSSDAVFVFEDVLTEGENGGEALLIIQTGTGLVLEVASGEPHVAGFFQGDFSPEELSSRDVSVAEPQFRDVTIRGDRYRILPWPGSQTVR